jgi:hypothetical protein
LISFYFGHEATSPTMRTASTGQDIAWHDVSGCSEFDPIVDKHPELLLPAGDEAGAAFET